ncbi:MAG: type II toxin-antitoxin system VapC family toxin [Prosthecobacter sp.]
MILCADTSFLLSFYGADVNTSAAIQHMSQRGVPLLAHVINGLEFENAVRLRQFRGKLTTIEGQLIITGYQGDIRAGRVVASQPDLGLVFQTAAHLSELHTPFLGNRAYDILQVAAAIVSKADEFLSFDERQRNLASAAGLLVAP